MADSSLNAARLAMRDETLSRWFAHYPGDLFPDVPLDQLSAAVAAIQATGITSDRLYGAWARHILFHVMQEIKQADDAILLDQPLVIEPHATRPLVERIDYYLAEREALDEHMRDVNARLARGETVMMGGAPVASIEDGWALLKEARDALTEAGLVTR